MEFWAITEKDLQYTHKVFASQAAAELYLNRSADDNFDEAIGVYHVESKKIIPSPSLENPFPAADSPSESLDDVKINIITDYVFEQNLDKVRKAMSTPLQQLTRASLSKTLVFNNTHFIGDARATDAEGSLTILFFPAFENFPLDNVIAHLRLKKDVFGNSLPIYLIKIDSNDKGNKDKSHTSTNEVPIEDVYTYFLKYEFIFSDGVFSGYKSYIDNTGNDLTSS